MLKEVKVPDIGDFKSVEIIDVAVKEGDKIAFDAPLITLETDKAAMDIPSPFAGTIKKLLVKVGDKVSKDSLILSIEVEAMEPASEKSAKKPPSSEQKPAAVKESIVDVVVPDIGGAKNVAVIEVLIKPGDIIEADDSLITLESDKASMDIPSPYSGIVQAVHVSLGDKLSQGSKILSMQIAQSENNITTSNNNAVLQSSDIVVIEEELEDDDDEPTSDRGVYAGPATRRLARDLGVELTQVGQGTGRKGRLTKEDVQKYVKAQLKKLQNGEGSGSAIPAMPAIDFTQFGEIEKNTLPRIKKLSGNFLHRNWLNIPHVTHFDEADITDMEAFRQEQKAIADSNGVRLTPLVFIMKALVSALQKFPTFNASLDPNGEELILKKYYNIGVAVDTPNGLVVPVVRGVDQKGFFPLARELGEISEKARSGQLTAQDMQGSCCTISSLGSIGGTGFTPIINAPDVAIVGVAKASMKPIYDGENFIPRLMLPISLSYDHRVIDGAQAARFTRFIAEQLADIRRLLL